MEGFKAQQRRDLEKVFFNEEEHADSTQVEYNGREYNIPIVIDREGAKDRAKPSSDNADGVFIADMTVYISFYDLRIVPRKETQIIIDGTGYNIVRVGDDAGCITLDLELFDE